MCLLKRINLHFDGPFEISTLKATFEYEGPIGALMVQVKLVVGLQFFIVSVKFWHATFVSELVRILIVPSGSTVGTFQLVGQVKRIENVALLIGFVY
jgi:Ca2+/Na+ antiporter